MPHAPFTTQVLPSVQVVSHVATPPSSCDLPRLIPMDAAVECTLCGDGQRVSIARSGSTSVYYRVVFHGHSCGPWSHVSPPTAPAPFDNRIRRHGTESALRISSAGYSALLLLPPPGPVPSSIVADRRSSRSARALQLPSLSVAAVALADYPAPSSFFVSHTPIFSDQGEASSSQTLRSRIVVETNRPLLLPGHLSWRVSSDIAVVSNSAPLLECFQDDVCSCFSRCRCIRANRSFYRQHGFVSPLCFYEFTGAPHL